MYSVRKTVKNKTSNNVIGVESDGSRLRFGNLASQKNKNSNNRHKCQNENHLCPPKVSQKEQHLWPMAIES